MGSEQLLLIILRARWSLTDLLIPFVGEAFHLDTPVMEVLLCQPPCKEGVQILGIQPHEAFEVLLSDVVSFVLLLSELRQVF